MLLKIHDLTRGWIAYVIFGLLIFVFALWGISSYTGVGGGRYVAEVNGEAITDAAFKQAMQNERDNLRQMFGGQLPEGLITDELIQQRALDTVVARTLIQQTLDKYGFQVSDREVLDYITAQPFFQENGQFSATRYANILTQQRLSKAGYEAAIREQMRFDQLRNGVAETAFVTANQTADLLRLKNQTRDVAFVLISAEQFRQKANPSDEEMRAFYEANAASYLTPERVKIEYVLLDESTLRAEVQPTEDDLQAFYQANLDRYITPESRHAAQILVTIKEGEEPADAKLRAEALIERLRTGADFAEVARTASDDPFAATTAGDLGLVARGDLEPQIEDVLFVLDVGQISEPVRTSQGWQILTVTEVVAATQRPLAELRAQIEAEYREREAEDRFFVLTEKLKTASYEHGDTLKPAAAALGTSVQETDWVTVDGGSGFAANPEVVRTAFSTRVLAEGRNSDLLEVGSGQLAVIRVGAHEPAVPQSFDTVRDQVRQALIESSLRDQVRQLGEATLAKVEAGASLAGEANRLGQTYEEVSALARTGKPGVAREIVGQAFVLARPGQGEQTFGGVQLASGDYAVIAVRAVHDGSGDEAQRQAFALGEQRALASREFDAFYEALEGRAEIKIYRENIE